MCFEYILQRKLLHIIINTLCIGQVLSYTISYTPGASFLKTPKSISPVCLRMETTIIVNVINDLEYVSI